MRGKEKTRRKGGGRGGGGGGARGPRKGGVGMAAAAAALQCNLRQCQLKRGPIGAPQRGVCRMGSGCLLYWLPPVVAARAVKAFAHRV